MTITSLKTVDSEARVNLIDNKPEEKLLAKLKQMQAQQLTNVQIARLKSLQAAFVVAYLELVKKFFNIGRRQILSFEKDERSALANIIFEKSKNYLYLELALFLIPIFGQVTWAVRLLDARKFRYPLDFPMYKYR